MEISNLDLIKKELENFIGQAQSSRVKSLLESELLKVNSEISNVQKQNQQLKPQQPSQSLNFTALTNYAWEQEGKNVLVFLTLEKIGELPQENIIINFTEQSLDVQIQGYQNKNLRLYLPKLCDKIDQSKSKFVIKKNSIKLTLQKIKQDHWAQIYYKESAFKPDTKKDSDPGDGLMNMMKTMYQEGDDEMKKTIAQAWQKSQEEKKK